MVNKRKDMDKKQAGTSAARARKTGSRWARGLSLACVAALALGGCKKLYDLPDAKEYLSPNINYQNKTLEPVLGRTSLLGSFNSDNSTLPLTFEIVNARYGDGRPVTDIFQTRPTYVWTAAYDGREESLAEIEAKRKLEDRPLFEVRESGQFIMWGSSSDDLIAPRPADSSDLVQDVRFFDLKVSNTGGEMLLTDFRLVPWRERPYSPSTDINPYTGGVAPDPTDVRNPNKRDYIRPNILFNVIGATSNRPMQSDDQIKDIVVYIRPVENATGTNTLRFAFHGPDGTPINPALFNETKWQTLVHGFNMQITNEYVQYDVAYPIPLVALNTQYTSNNGTNARAEFSYSRRGFGGNTSVGGFGLDFAIYRAGNWEVVFHFRNELPKFEDE